MKNLKIKKTMTYSIDIIKKRFFFLLLFSTLLSRALIASETNTIFSLTAINNTTVLLQLPENIDSTLTISLYDSEGLIKHQDELIGGTVKRVYNLQELNSGTYVFEISFDRTKKWKKIKVEAGILKTIDENFQMIIEPSVKLNDGHLDLNLLCFSDSKVNLTIRDEDGQLLSDDYLAANGSIGKRYNITNLKEGEYQLDISINDPSINFEFSKRIEIRVQETIESNLDDIALNKTTH